MINKQLEKLIKETLESMSINVMSIKVSVSARPDLCDYQCNDLFKIAKSNNLDIQQLGQALVDNLKSLFNYDEYFKDIEFIRPGFLNIVISDK